MANLMKCDNCGNRYTMCFLCDKNKHYRETKHSYKQSIRNDAIYDFFKELQKYEDDDGWLRLKMSTIYEIAEQIKEGEKNE